MAGSVQQLSRDNRNLWSADMLISADSLCLIISLDSLKIQRPSALGGRRGGAAGEGPLAAEQTPRQLPRRRGPGPPGVTELRGRGGRWTRTGARTLTRPERRAGWCVPGVSENTGQRLDRGALAGPSYTRGAVPVARRREQGLGVQGTWQHGGSDRTGGAWGRGCLYAGAWAFPAEVRGGSRQLFSRVGVGGFAAINPLRKGRLQVSKVHSQGCRVSSR